MKKIDEMDLSELMALKGTVSSISEKYANELDEYRYINDDVSLMRASASDFLKLQRVKKLNKLVDILNNIIDNKLDFYLDEKNIQ